MANQATTVPMVRIGMVRIESEEDRLDSKTASSRRNLLLPPMIKQGRGRLMTRSLKAVYEKGVLRPLEPLPLKEHQQVTVTVSDEEDGSWIDTGFLRYLEAQADESVTLEHVRTALAKIPGSMTPDFRKERDDRA
jgi:predicted DNA-binding antitoxin AbrB/MazE fold protein